MTNFKSRSDETAAAPGFFGKFGVFKDAIPELWISFAIKCISIAAYGLMNSTLVIWLHYDLGYPDNEALPIISWWAVIMTIMNILAGSLTDTLGLRRTLFMGTIFCIIGRAIMTFTTVKWFALFGGLGAVAIGEALGGPVLVAAARKYSNTRQRSMSFSMIYAMMNLGFFIGAWLFDKFRREMGEHGQWNVAGFHITTYQTLFFVSLILEIILLPLIYLLRDGAEATDEGVKITPRELQPAHQTFIQSILLTTKQAVIGTITLFRSLLKQTGFYKLLTFLCLIAFVKLIYRQMDYIYPTFGIRELGPGAPIGVLWGMNSLLIILLTPFVGALTQKYSAYSMVIVGGLISAASIFIMALPPGMFVPMADGWFGDAVGHWYLGLHGSVHPYYVMIMIFVIVLSIGEAFYSPRVYEYAASIAPKGQEASYSALSYVPLMLAKLLIAVFSGNWLMKYCPEVGPRHSETLWLIVALMSLVAPIGLIALRRVIQVKEAGREESAA